MKRVFLAITLVMGIVLSPIASSAKTKHKTYQTKSYKKRHTKGFKFKKHVFQAMRHRSFVQEKMVIPKSTDLSNFVSLPEDQGQCGACWAFSLTKALRSEYMIKEMDPGILEFNYLLDNCGPGPSMQGCNGGDFSAAMSFENQAGPGLNSENPFIGKSRSCKHLPIEATAVSYSMLGDANQGPTFEELTYAVGVEKHMLSIDVAAGSGDWENYSGGIYNDCKGTPGDIDHMINAVGYDCETSVDSAGNCVFDPNGKPLNGDGYLIVENNWGEDWGTKAANGHGGYMKTRMYGPDGSKCNAIATDALMFEIKDPEPIPTPSITPAPVHHCTKFLCSLFCFFPWCD